LRKVNANGDFDIWQLGTEFGPSLSGAMLADMWRYHNTSDAEHRIRRSADVPTFAEAKRVLRQSLEIEVIKPAAAITSHQNTALVYRGEGSEWAPLHGIRTKQRLWLKSSVAGVYHIGLANGAENLSCPTPITVPAPDVWFPLEVVLPAAPLVEWRFDRRVGYSMYMFLAVGSHFFGQTGQWLSGYAAGDSSQVNFNAAAGSVIRIAGWELGSAEDTSPPEFARPEAEELRCMRYIETSFSSGVAPMQGIGAGSGEELVRVVGSMKPQESLVRRFIDPKPQTPTILHESLMRRFIVPKRRTPVMTSYNPVTTNNEMRNLTLNIDCEETSFDNVTDRGFRASCRCPGSTSAGNAIGFHWLADASLPAAGSGSFD